MQLLKRIYSLAWRFIAVISIVLIPIGYFIVFTNIGLRFTLATVPRLLGVEISQEKVQGSFYQGFIIRRIKLESKDYIIFSDQIKWIWQQNKYRKVDNLLRVKLVELGHISYLNLKTDKINPPRRPPKSLHLPFNFQIDEIRISSLSVGSNGSPIISNGQFHLSYQNNLYTLQIGKLIVLSSVNKGFLSLKDQDSFELTGQIDSYGLDSNDIHYGFIKISDSLKQPLLESNIKNKDLEIIGYIHLSPFDPISTRRIVEANIAGSKINPQKFVSNWINAELSFKLISELKQDEPEVFHGKFQVKNTRPAYYAKHGVPIKEIFLDFQILEDGTVSLSKGNLSMIQDGVINAMGAIYPDGSIKLLANVYLGLINFMPTPLKNTYRGQAVLEGAYLNPILKINAQSPWNELVVNAQFRSKDRTLLFNNFRLSKFNSYFEGVGKFYLKDKFGVDLDLLGRNFNPNTLNPNYPKGSINGEVNIRGNIDESLYVMTNIKNSQISNASFSAQGFTEFNSKGINESDIRVVLGDNHLTLNGKINNHQNKMNIDINMPNLQYFGFGISGKAFAKGYIQGTFERLVANLKGRFNQIKFPSFFSLDDLTFDLNISPELNAPFKIDIKGNGLVFKNFSINNISSLFTGTLASHAGISRFSFKLPNQEVLTGHYRARGGFDKNYLWSGYMEELNLSGFINLLLQNSVRVQANWESLKIGDARWTILGGLMHLNDFEWNKGKGFKTRGDIRNLQLVNLKNFILLPFEQNIVVHGDWNLAYNENASGYIKLTKQSGDILFSRRKTPLGLERFDIGIQLFSNKIKGLLDANTRFASGQAQITILQNFGKNFKTSALQGQINVSSKDIGTLKYTLPVGMYLKGKIDSKINISGTVGDPKFNGYVTGTDMAYRDLSNGISLHNGQLNSSLIGKQWIIEQLVFKNKDGSITLKGKVGEINQRYGIDLDLFLDHYLVMNQPNRRFVISGVTKIKLDETSGLGLTGYLRLDKGKYENLGDSVPQLSDDVHIVGSKKEPANDSLPFTVNLGVDLNNQLRFILSDLDFLVGGKLLLKAEKGKSFKVFGEVVAINGQYRAYGQNLRAEKGTLIFTGNPTNAQMNVRARRYQSPVGAGVDVTGTFNNPRISLIADKPMSELEKLSWLILGRESQGEDDNNALALAVGVLAAEKVNKEAGSVLDNIGLSSNKTRNVHTGELNPAEQMITLGKQLNENLYMGYEFGIQNSTQAVRLIYMISKLLNIFSRIGTESSGGGIKYKIRFD